VKARRKGIRCECGGTERPVTLTDYDFSAYAGFAVRIEEVPGFRCSRCKTETLDGRIINAVLKILVIEIAQLPFLLPPHLARYLRTVLGDTQEELAVRMGISRATVNRWETGQERIAPQNDLLLRVLTLYPLVTTNEKWLTPVVVELLAKLQAVRTSPPPLEGGFPETVSVAPMLSTIGPATA